MFEKQNTFGKEGIGLYIIKKVNMDGLNNLCIKLSRRVRTGMSNVIACIQFQKSKCNIFGRMTICFDHYHVDGTDNKWNYHNVNKEDHKLMADLTSIYKPNSRQFIRRKRKKKMGWSL